MKYKIVSTKLVSDVLNGLLGFRMLKVSNDLISYEIDESLFHIITHDVSLQVCLPNMKNLILSRHSPYSELKATFLASTLANVNRSKIRRQLTERYQEALLCKIQVHALVDCLIDRFAYTKVLAEGNLLWKGGPDLHHTFSLYDFAPRLCMIYEKDNHVRDYRLSKTTGNLRNLGKVCEELILSGENNISKLYRLTNAASNSGCLCSAFKTFINDDGVCILCGRFVVNAAEK
jgi:hypothetical protein